MKFSLITIYGYIFRSRSRIKASVVLMRADYLCIHNYIRSLILTILRPILMVRTRLESASYCFCLFLQLNHTVRFNIYIYIYIYIYHYFILQTFKTLHKMGNINSIMILFKCTHLYILYS